MSILNDALIRILEGTETSLWLCNRDAQRVPDVVRLMGVRADPDRRHVVGYLSLADGEEVIRNLHETPQLTLLAALIHTYESYQFKGVYTGQWACSAEEVEYQRVYVEGFARTSMRYHMSSAKIAQAYFRQPALAVRMQIEEIYEQTPRQGTGGRIQSA